MWLPKTCPQCGAAKITFKSVGLTKVAQLAKKHLPGWPALVLEKGKAPLIPDKPHLLITTDAFWSSRYTPFAPVRYGLVAELAADLSLYAGDSGALEVTARRLQRTAAFARRQRAQLIYQTSDRALLDPALTLATTIATERSLRKKYSLPPYGQPDRTPLPQP
jgi:primosomal protein N'